MNEIRVLLSDELDSIEKGLSNVIKMDDAIFKSLNDFVTGKSKRIRSVVTLLYLKANNTLINDDIMSLLIATELMHNASLLHDDVIDDAPTRRGVNTIKESFDSKISVLSGDYLLSISVDKLLSIKNEKILKLFLDTAKKMSEAEIMQYRYRNTQIPMEIYIDIISGKTASLFSACMQSSAILSGITSDIASNFGEKFGILFQINNDMKPESHLNDIKNGVNTITDILGIEKTLVLKDNYKKELRELLINIPESKYKTGIEDLIKLL